MSFIRTVLSNRIIRYLISGGSAVVTDLGLLYIMTRYLHIWYLLSAVVAFVISVYVSFMLQKFFTFNDYTRDHIKKQMTLYLILQLVNLGLNTLFMYIGVDLLHAPYIASQITISAVMAASNFFIYRRLIFVSVSDKISQ